jgi:hypothetical protein
MLFDLITHIVFGDQYRAGTSLYYFYHSVVPSFVSGQNIFLSTLFSNTFSLCLFLLETRFDTHIKQQGKVIVLNILILLLLG